MNKSSTNIALNSGFDSEDVITNLIETARTLREADEMQSVEFFEKAMMLSRNTKFLIGIGDCLIELAGINQKKGDVSSALNQLHEATNLFEKSQELKKAIDCSLQISDISFAIGNYQQALESRLSASHFAKLLGNEKLECTILNKIGEVYKVIEEFEKAIDYHLKSLKISERLNDKRLNSVTNYYLGNCYNWMNSLESAFTYLDTSLRLAEELNDLSLKVKPTGSLAILFTKLKEYEKSMDYFFQSIYYVNLLNDLPLKANLLKSLGNLFIEKKEYDQAIQTLKESLAIAEENDLKFPKNIIHEFLSKAYEKSGDFKNALKHHKIYSAISNEINKDEIALKATGIQLQLELDETRKKKELAEIAVHYKDQFIANISHEIRTPLNGVLGMSNLLADTNPTPEQLEYINTIKLSANNLIVVINDILDYSKIQSGDIKFDNTVFKIRDLITGIAQTVKIKADEKNIDLSFTYDKHIPETLIGDPLRLNQILFHLFNNAIKFTEKGFVKVDMQMVESKGLSIKILFTISDSGIGISGDQINTIFESFTQVARVNNKLYNGTGLGLAIVKHLVDLQGGNISINSKVDEGSVFKIELPFKLERELEKTGKNDGTKSEIAFKDLTKVHVLLVEDNKVNQFLAQKLLTKMGFVVSISNNGHEAVDSLKSNKFDIILMDVQMPEMNGYELTEIIRNILPAPSNQIPIIALTAYASLQEKEKALALGMSDYITKPYSPDELLTAILKQVRLNDLKPDADIISGKEITADDVRQSAEKLTQLFSGSTEDVLSLLHMLVGQIPQLVAESETFIKEKNWTATFQSIHKLKSSINLLKINVLKNSVAELEEFSRDQIHTDRIPPIFEEFRKSCEKTVSLIKDEIIRLKKTN